MHSDGKQNLMIVPLASGRREFDALVRNEFIALIQSFIYRMKTCFANQPTRKQKVSVSSSNLQVFLVKNLFQKHTPITKKQKNLEIFNLSSSALPRWVQNEF
jgi:hypothetical protein